MRILEERKDYTLFYRIDDKAFDMVTLSEKPILYVTLEDNNEKGSIYYSCMVNNKPEFEKLEEDLRILSKEALKKYKKDKNETVTF